MMFFNRMSDRDVIDGMFLLMLILAAVAVFFLGLPYENRMLVISGDGLNVLKSASAWICLAAFFIAIWAFKNEQDIIRMVFTRILAASMIFSIFTAVAVEFALALNLYPPLMLLMAGIGFYRDILD